MDRGKIQVPELTWREQEVLALFRDRLSDREIAVTLSLSVNSVKWYTRQIYNKLGVNNRREAMAWLETAEQATQAPLSNSALTILFALMGRLLGRLQLRKQA